MSKEGVNPYNYTKIIFHSQNICRKANHAMKMLAYPQALVYLGETKSWPTRQEKAKANQISRPEGKPEPQPNERKKLKFTLKEYKAIFHKSFDLEDDRLPEEDFLGVLTHSPSDRIHGSRTLARLKR